LLYVLYQPHDLAVTFLKIAVIDPELQNSGQLQKFFTSVLRERVEAEENYF
jgi:hypothetical protein